MLRACTLFLLIAGFGTTSAAQQLQVPTGEKSDEQGKSAFAVEQRARERPIRIEQSCPPPESVDLFQTSTWNTVEFGLSFPLGEGSGEARPYTRYTCPNPGVKVRR
jgi:hypothetical protein